MTSQRSESRILRSFLFVPANRPERYAKALAAGADAVIIDLEDAVPAAEKGTARQTLLQWLSNGGSAMIRINGAKTAFFSDDLSLCSIPTVQGIVLPMTEDPAEIARVSDSSKNARDLFPMIETARGFANALAIASSPQVRRLLFGSIDFQLDLGISGEREELLYFRSGLVLASRIAGIESPVDGVTTTFENADSIRDDSLRAKRLGFGGKLCIHPSQVSVVNERFAPSAEEIAWAKRVIAGARAAAGAAVSVDGAMVDRPVIARAEAILSATVTPE